MTSYPYAREPVETLTGKLLAAQAEIKELNLLLDNNIALRVEVEDRHGALLRLVNRLQGDNESLRAEVERLREAQQERNAEAAADQQDIERLRLELGLSEREDARLRAELARIQSNRVTVAEDAWVRGCRCACHNPSGRHLKGLGPCLVKKCHCPYGKPPVTPVLSDGPQSPN